MLGCFTHAKDARGFEVGKLILFKDVHIGQPPRVWATICLIFKSTSATFPGRRGTSPASLRSGVGKSPLASH